MAVTIDIFNPQVSKVAEGLAGKTLMIFGGNNLGKSYQAARLSKPFFIACESGLNAIADVKYQRANTWGDIIKMVKQLTSPATVDKAREMYDTVVIDEVYASSIMCQDFVVNTYGNGALTLGDSNGKINLYQMYEKTYFKMVNALLSADYTVVFIGHAQEKDGYITPKGDKRCINPIIDNCDFVIYLESNGVDENGKVIKSSAYLAETDRFFARSRFEHCQTYIKEFTAENLEKVVIEAVKNEEKASGVKAITYAEQKEQNITKQKSYDELMEELQTVGMRFADADKMDELQEVVEARLGAGGKVSNCTKNQTDVMGVILDELIEKADELGI